MCPYCQKIDQKFYCAKVRKDHEGFEAELTEYLRTCYPMWCPLDYCILADDGK
jgi:hypothetical protein